MTKPRKHGRNPGGRPTNRQKWEEQQGQIDRLRQLVVHRRQSDETWHLVDRLLTLINELEDLATPQRGAALEGPGHGAETPTFAGVRMAPASDEPGYDPDKHKGNRDLMHAGTYAGEMLTWFYRQVRWTIATTERRLEHREPDPRPSVPKPPPPVKDPEGQ